MLRTLMLSTTLLAAGCGGSSSDRWTENRPKTIPASGVVTLQGRPVEGASVSFVPADRAGTAAFALTDAEGRFDLNTFSEKDGAVAGQYTVTVTKKSVETTPNPKDPNGPPLKSVEKSDLPVRYASSGTSKLTASVSDSGDNQFQFDLQN